MAVEARSFAPADAEPWDALVAGTGAASFLHARRFLGYHGERFEDASVCITGDDGTLRGEAMLEALEAVATHLRERGFATLEYKPLPWIYHVRPAQDDLYALFRLGARRSRVDLSCAVDLAAEIPPSSRRRRGRKKAEKAGVAVRSGPEHAARIWEVLEQTLAARHGARPVHDLEEILLLAERFPEEIEFLAADLDGTAVAGVVLFHGRRVSHAQYIASLPEGNDVGALDAVFAHAIEEARGAGRRFFDFGTSNRERGLVLNASLYEYKAQYGGGGVAYEAYELPLPPVPPSSSSRDGTPSSS